jgi:hypothetical protein
MSAGKQPQSPKGGAAQQAKNKEAVLECPVCSHPFMDGKAGDTKKKLAILGCGHGFCHECVQTIKNIAAAKEEFHHCPICRSEYPEDVPSHFAASLLEVIAQQDADMAAVRAAAAAAAADAAAVLLAVRAEAADAAAQAAAELLAVRAEAAGTAAELAAVLAKQALAVSTAAAKAETASMRLADQKREKERVAAKKASDSADQDEIEKSMREVEKERETLKRRERLQREEDKDKDWKPKRRY